MNFNLMFQYIKSRHFTIILLSLSLLLTSCTVYNKTSVSLAKAAASESEVKAETNQGTIVHLKKVYLEDHQYYGIMIRTKAIVPLDDSAEYFLKNRDLSTLIGIAIGLGVFVLLYYASIMSEFG